MNIQSQNQIQIPALLPIRCAILGKSFSVSEPQFPYLDNEDRLLWGLNDTLGWPNSSPRVFYKTLRETQTNLLVKAM